MLPVVPTRVEPYVCYRCQGDGEFRLWIGGQPGPVQLCPDCDGLGVVPAEQWERWQAGRQMAADRKARHVTQSQEARRLGITVKELSNREWGRS